MPRLAYARPQPVYPPLEKASAVDALPTLQARDT